MIQVRNQFLVIQVLCSVNLMASCFLNVGLSELLNTHLVTSSVADTISQWHNAGGMIQYYDFPLEEYVDV